MTVRGLFLAALLTLCNWPVMAQKWTSQIELLQSKYESTAREIITSQSRILANKQAFGSNESTYELLDLTANNLDKVARRLDALYSQLFLFELITDKANREHGRRGVERLIKELEREASSLSGFVEKTLPRAKDAETTRLILQARDLLKNTGETASALMP